jgi:hypothetical protein
MKIRISILLLLLFIGCNSEDNFGLIQVESNADTTLARIGDIINLDVRIHNVGDKILNFPDIQETESMEVRSKLVFVKENNLQNVKFEIVFWDTGNFSIPEYPVQILNADSTLDSSIMIDSIKVTVISMLEGAEDTNLRPIKDPVAIKAPFNWYTWSLAVLLAFLVMVLIGLVQRRIKKTPLEKISVSESQTAKDIAIIRLDELQKIIKVDCKSFYLHASFLLREFIENQFYIRALEMTTTEIRVFKDYVNLGKNNFTGIINILKRSDLAKFAKYDFTITERQSDYNWIYKLINNFKER